MNKGFVYGLLAYVLWGVLPVYWKFLRGVSAMEIVAHRMVWSLLFLAFLLMVSRNWAWLRLVLKRPKTMLAIALAAGLLSVNWLTYIWGVNAGFVIETSLGYFINPLVNVLLGVLFLRERLRTGQWLAIAFAAAGVLYMSLNLKSLPWIALTLAFTFGFYGLIKKKIALKAVEGLSLEMGILFLPAAGYLFYLQGQGQGALGHSAPLLTALLVFTGVITAMPLLLFAAAARRIPLSALGLLQYVAPTMQFLLGVYVFGEPFTHTRMVGFSLIWLALILYTTESVVIRRRKKALGYAG